MKEVDAYVLAGSRSAAAAAQFPNRFVPSRQLLTDELPVPQFSAQPSAAFESAETLIERLEAEPREPYALYWDNVAPSVSRQGMLFFTADGHMIAGLVVNEAEAERALSEVADCVCGGYGFITGDSAPPETRSEFIQICRGSTITAFVDGKLRRGG